MIICYYLNEAALVIVTFFLFYSRKKCIPFCIINVCVWLYFCLWIFAIFVLWELHALHNAYVYGFYCFGILWQGEGCVFRVVKIYICTEHRVKLLRGSSSLVAHTHKYSSTKYRLQKTCVSPSNAQCQFFAEFGFTLSTRNLLINGSSWLF